MKEKPFLSKTLSKMDRVLTLGRAPSNKSLLPPLPLPLDIVIE